MAATQAWAYWLEGPHGGALRAEMLALPGEGEVRVRARYSGVSRGTELLVHRGEVPPGEHDRMRAPFQAGTFPWPVKYGYSSVGVIEAGPPHWLGREVFCLYPHQTCYVVPLASVQPLPAGLPAGRAVLAANMETALNAVWDADVRPGDRVSVVGGGVVGQLVAWLAAGVPACEVELVDVDERREATARALGVAFATPERARPDADRVVHASATAQGLATALRLAGFEAVVTELSWFGARPVTLPLGEAFHSQRLTLRSSQVGAVAGSQRARWPHARRLAAALGLLRDARLDALIGPDTRFEDLPALMRELAVSGRPALCERIRYD